METELKPLVWVGDSKKLLELFPEDVRRFMGYALFRAQEGKKHPDAKPLKGFGGAGVLEIMEDYDGDTYRAVYTVKLVGVIYALHAFMKKSKRGIETPKQEMNKIRERLKEAQRRHAEWTKGERIEP